MRYLSVLILSVISCLSLEAQIDAVCPFLEVSAMRALPANPAQELGPRLEIEITVDTFISEWGIGGYVNLVLVDALGDSITEQTGPNYWLPGNPSDTGRIQLRFRSGLETLPDGFSGVLYTMDPNCIVPVDGLVRTEYPEREIGNLKIYPNPSPGQVFINGDELARIRLYSPLGQVLETRIVNGRETQLDLNQWRTNQFVLVVEDQTGRISTRTILKQ